MACCDFIVVTLFFNHAFGKRQYIHSQCNLSQPSENNALEVNALTSVHQWNYLRVMGVPVPVANGEKRITQQ